MKNVDESSQLFPFASSHASSSPRANTTPCAACKTLRRRCLENCVLAPFFPSGDLLKFAIAHRVFGASNVSKLLQEIPEHQRADAADSIVYEANARIRDPVYGCAGIISHLQNKVIELEEELAKLRAAKSVSNRQIQNSFIMGSSFSMEMPQHPADINSQQQLPWDCTKTSFSDEDGRISMALVNHFGLE